MTKSGMRGQVGDDEIPGQAGNDKKRCPVRPGMTEERDARSESGMTNRPGMTNRSGMTMRTMEKKGYIYFVTNKSNRVLYTGVTNSLVRRSSEHGEHCGSAFTFRYNCSKLVYYEVFPDMEQAIAREKQLKHFKREWKDQLVNAVNPGWGDLAEGLVADPDEMPDQVGHDVVGRA